MAFLQGDNKYRPRSKAEKRRLQEQRKRELEAKRERNHRNFDSSSTFIPSYSYPKRNTHVKITSGSDHVVPKDDAQSKIEYTEEMLEREKAARAEAERRKKCIAPAFNKGPYQYIASTEQAKHVGK
jgi:hypothetical protein